MDLPVICTFEFCVGIVARQDILFPVLSSGYLNADGPKSCSEMYVILGFMIFLNYSGIREGALDDKNITLVAVFVTQLRDLSS